MRTSNRWVATVALCICTVVPGARAQTSPSLQVATPAPYDAHAGDDFLKLIDTKRYAESWDAASGFLKQSASRGDWAAQMVKTRETIGDVSSRRLKEAKPEHNPAGAPAGDYLLMTYETVFASQGAPKTETLPLVKSPDGQWRAVGYFVR